MQRSARLSPRRAVLGLLVQESGTVADISRRLTEHFPHAGFPRNSAHTNLPSLAEDGYARRVSAGSSTGLDLYEALPDGVAETREWLRSPSLPAVPDLVDAILALLERGDAPAALQTIRRDERASKAACSQAHADLLAHSETVRSRKSWRDGARKIGLEYNAKRWASRAEHLAFLGDRVEALFKGTTPDG